jgi:uncharacterized membrane protein
MTSNSPAARQTTLAPGLAEGISVKQVSFEAPWEWLAAGWRDLWTHPAISLSYGAVFAVAAGVLVAAMMQEGWQAAVPALAGGFLLIGPMLAVGLYEESRRLEAGEPIDPRDIMLVGVRSPGQLAMLGVLLLIIFFVWIEVAFGLFTEFLGAREMPPMAEFLTTLLFTPRGVGLLVAGTAAGAVLAAVVFAITAVSVPLLMVREVDVVSAAMASLTAVRLNLRPMALWAALIAGMMAVGFATLFVGLIVLFPLIGHATWHAYKDLVSLKVEPEIVPAVV